MADKVNSSNRYTLDINGVELHFIQHCIVYSGCCISGNLSGAKDALSTVLSVLPLVNTDELQKRILSLVGIDVSKLDEAYDGVTWINQDGSLEKKENIGISDSDNEDLNRLLSDKNIQ